MPEVLSTEGLLKENTFLKDELDRKDKIIAALTAKLYGSGKNERIDEAQLLLALSEAQAQQKDVEQEQQEQTISYKRKPRQASVEDRFPKDIEVIEERILPEEVKAHPEDYEEISGARVTEVLDIVPMRFIKRRYIYPKFRKKSQPELPPVLAKSVSQLLKGSIASERLMVYVLISKYMDHLPLHRLESIFKKRYDVVLSRKTMSDWLGSLAEDWLSIIYYSIRDDLRSCDYLHVDETPISYRDPVLKGKCRKGYFWVYCDTQGVCFYDWQNGRGYQNVAQMLGDYKGYLQCDQYSVYQTLAKRNPNIELLACMAHVRRKFKEAWDSEELTSSAWYLLQIRELYQNERLIKEEGHDVVAFREQKSLPILKRIKERADQDSLHLKPSKCLDAIKYLQSCYKELVKYVSIPTACIDNNPAEQIVRPTKLGARNWLFIGHQNAGKKSAIIYTLIENCKRAGVNPEHYLTDVLQRLPKLTSNPEVIRQLQPHNWKPENNF